MSKTERLNARVDPQLADKLAQIRRMTGANTAQILRASVELYHASLASELQPAARILESTDYVGCATGDADLSATYKARLSRSLSRKSSG